MPERYERLLRLVCFVLGGVLLLRLGWLVVHPNPLAHLKIPAVPTLAAADLSAGGKGTNIIPGSEGTKPSTNTQSTAKGANTTNSPASKPATKGMTNTTAGPSSTHTNTNSVASSEVSETATNLTVSTNTFARTNLNAVNASKVGTNSVAAAGPSAQTSTNSAAAAAIAKVINPQPNPGMPGKPRDLSPDVQARVDRITDSEILGPVMRPLPMALLGIAGNVAFLRAPNGQTGLVKEGGDLGELKLLRIGINRVLIEQEGQKKELMIFSGFGGDSLLPK